MMDLLPLELLLSPVALALLGLCVGSFLNVVIHRLPLMLERQWWADVAQQLADADSWRRVFRAAAPTRSDADHLRTATALSQSVAALAPLTSPARVRVARPAATSWLAREHPAAQLAALRAAARPATRASRHALPARRVR